MNPRRRQVLGLGAGLGATLALPGCATPGGASAGRVVVVGGGYGGATAARYLKRWGGALQVTLVERQAQFVSCPMSNLVLVGQRSMADITRPYDGLRDAGVRLVRGEVAGIDAAARSVRLVDGSTLPYDRLVLSPGIDFVPDAIGGLGNPDAQGAVLHAWKAGAQTLALRARLEAMPDGGTVVLSVPRAPYRCPPGPYERACLIAAWLRRAKPRAKLLLCDANPEIQSKKALFERAFKQHHDGILEYRPNTELKEVDAATRTARFEFDDVKADVLNVIPPQRAAEVARAAGVVNVNARWAGVDWLSMESTAVSGIHVLGDATFPAPAMPKSGHIANQQAKVAAAAVIALLKGEPVNPQPVMANTCYSFVTADEAIHVASVHQYDVAQKTLVPVAGAGGVSAAASRDEGRYALDWARNIWADSLGVNG